MPRKRRTKKQIAAAEAQSARMKLKWEQARQDNDEMAKRVAIVHDVVHYAAPLLDRVYMAGWQQIKAQEIRGFNNMMSKSQALQALERYLRIKLELKSEDTIS